MSDDTPVSKHPQSEDHEPEGQRRPDEDSTLLMDPDSTTVMHRPQESGPDATHEPDGEPSATVHEGDAEPPAPVHEGDAEPPAAHVPPAPEPVTDEPVAHKPAVQDEPTTVYPAASTVGAQPQVIYVTQPAPPVRKGNRGFGTAMALLAGLIFAVLLAIAVALFGSIAEGVTSFNFLQRPLFYAPVALFILGFVLLVLIVNRANWWAYIVGSLVVGLFVYFGTILVGMLGAGLIQNPDAAGQLFRSQLGAPFVILSALLAREVAMWVGAGISRRGRAVRARNLEARAAYDRDVEQKRAERERIIGVPA